MRRFPRCEKHWNLLPDGTDERQIYAAMRRQGVEEIQIETIDRYIHDPRTFPGDSREA